MIQPTYLGPARYRVQRQDDVVGCDHDGRGRCHAKGPDEYGWYWHERPAWHVWDTVIDDYAAGTGPAQFPRRRDALTWVAATITQPPTREERAPMPYIYKRTEPTLWTVGTYDSGEWDPESDHGSEAEAADRVIVLNGGTPPDRGLTAAAALVELRDQLREHVANLSDKQPWDNRAMFDRVLVVLNAVVPD